MSNYKYDKLKILIAYGKGRTTPLDLSLAKKVLTEELKEIAREIEFSSYENKLEDTPSKMWEIVQTTPTHLMYGDPQKMIDHISDVDVVMVQYAPVLRDVIEVAPKLKVIGVVRTGPDNVDWHAATERGITVIGAIGRNTTSVAEVTMGLILCEMRNICRGDVYIKSMYGKKKSRSERIAEMIKMQTLLEGPELEGKTLGIVGLGRIGRKVVKMARGFDMNIIGYDPFLANEIFKELGVKKVGLDTLMSTSDVITIHIRLKPGEKHIIGKREIALMKPSAYLINTSDGPVVDNKALIEALENHRIMGIGDGPVYQLDPSKYHFTASGGTTSMSKEVAERGIRMVAHGISMVLKGEEPANKVTTPLFNFKTYN
jgi:D-3-phosphoglycerate dehydrogenase